MANDKHEPSEREQAMIAAFAQSMRTVLDPLMARLERLESSTPDEQKQLSPDELHAKLMRELRGQSEDVAAIGLVEVITGCASDLGAPDGEGVMHGAAFDAEIHYKPVLTNGRVVGKTGIPVVKRLLNYAEPVGFDRHHRDGGLVPDGMAMQEVGAGGMRFTDSYKQWIWTTFLQADTQRFVGKPLPVHVRKAA